MPRENEKILKSQQRVSEKLFKFYCYLKNFEKSDPTNNGEFKFLYKTLSKAAKNNHHNLTLFDIGSHHGEFVETIKKNSNRLSLQVTIHSFEPLAENFQILANKFKQLQNVYLNNLAISTREGEDTMYANFSSSEGASFSPRKNLSLIKNTFNYQEKVKKIRLDNYIKKQKIDSIYYIKIDVEGHELATLESLGQYLNSNFIQYIHFEYNPDFEQKLADFYKLLSQKNYHLYQITRQGNLYRQPYNLQQEKFFANYVACDVNKKFINPTN